MANERRLIDAERVTEMLKKAAVYMLNGFPDSYDTGVSKGLIDAADIVNHARTVDAVEVVRCKDCKYSGMYCFGDSTDQKLACLDIEEDGFIRCAKSVDPNDFCSCGERRCDNGF